MKCMNQKKKRTKWFFPPLLLQRRNCFVYWCDWRKNSLLFFWWILSVLCMFTQISTHNKKCCNSSCWPFFFSSPDVTTTSTSMAERFCMCHHNWKEVACERLVAAVRHIHPDLCVLSSPGTVNDWLQEVTFGEWKYFLCICLGVHPAHAHFLSLIFTAQRQQRNLDKITEVWKCSSESLGCVPMQKSKLFTISHSQHLSLPSAVPHSVSNKMAIFCWSLCHKFHTYWVPNCWVHWQYYILLQIILSFRHKSFECHFASWHLTNSQ